MDPSSARRQVRSSLQPRAAAALDFHDSDDDEGLLSADYKAQRRTTQDLVDFFNSAPPPPPPTLPPVMEETEKKKKSFMQRLRPKKSSSSMGNGNGNSSNNSSSSRLSQNGSSSLLGNRASGVPAAAFGTGSNISTGRNSTSASSVGATLPNGKKYIMIAVDYKDMEGAGASTGAGSALASGASSLNASKRPGVSGSSMGTATPRRQSRILDENTFVGSKRTSMMSSSVHPAQGTNMTTPNISSVTVQEGGSSVVNGADKRRSIVLQSGGGEGSMFILDSTPFLLDNFALDTDFITQTNGSKATNGTGVNGSTGGQETTQQSTQPGISQNGVVSSELEEMRRTGSKRGNKVTFNISAEEPMDEAAVAEALAQRLASHKAQQAKNPSATLTPTEGETATASSQFPEIILPKPVSRKKVRHVQIQTQHCIMRPMFTQTEPVESLADDLAVKEWSTTTVASSSAGTTTDMGTSMDANQTTGQAKDASVTTTTTATVTPQQTLAKSKVASLVASLSQPTAATTATTTTTTMATPASRRGSSGTAKGSGTTLTGTGVEEAGASLPEETKAMHEELTLLRQQNTLLQTQITSLQRDLASETRARTRTAVAMQDTRDKFEMLSAMAYKKLKEMIFQRHVLELEVRELRSQVELQNEGELMHHHHQQRRDPMTMYVGQN